MGDSRSVGVPIIGDDIKSQVGATIVHRVLTRLMEDRGAEIDNTYQLNFGGNTDFLNMLERDRLVSKKISKTGSVTSQMDEEPGGGHHSHRPQRPCAVVAGSQMVLHPHRRQGVRGRAGEDGS